MNSQACRTASIMALAGSLISTARKAMMLLDLKKHLEEKNVQSISYSVTDYLAISQMKVPPQPIYLLSLHLINPLNKWK